MADRSRRRIRALAAGTGGIAVATAFTAGIAATPAHAAGAPNPRTATFANGGKLTSPDDITTLDGKIFVAFQNGVGSMGEPSSSGGIKSTIVEYTRAGKKLASWDVTGKVDGMTADRAAHQIVATVNEDGNSSLYTIRVRGAASHLTHYDYSANPLPHGGGTDSIAVVGGKLIVTASAPAADANGTTYSKPALYEVKLSGTTATPTPIFSDNAPATDAVTGQQTQLNLSDPDSSLVMPRTATRFAGQLLLDSQGDSQLVFLAHPGSADATASVLNLATQVDDTAVATSKHGTLFVVDGSADQIKAISGSFPLGQVIVAIPADSSSMAGTLATLNLKTGKLTPFKTGFKSPKGLLFVPSS